jgi:hypothetical protein
LQLSDITLVLATRDEARNIERFLLSIPRELALVVYAIDHRRIEGARAAKTLHSIARCLLLYTGLMPEDWRRLDWGYWKNRNP